MMSERIMQAVLLTYLLRDKQHDFAITNSTVLFPWEADIVSVTRAGFVHEVEVKISKSDFCRDRKDKPWKHMNLEFPASHPRFLKPNYFWYATPESIEITPPEYAGWMEVYKVKSSYQVRTRKEAPRLHTIKFDQKHIAVIARLLSFRLMNEYWNAAQREWGNEGKS